MSHTHTWQMTAYVLLSLPRDGFSERFTSWACQTCSSYCVITGDVRHGYPLKTPEFWDQAAQTQPRWTRS